MCSYIDVIKFGGNSDSVIWKYPIEDFNNNTQLIVNENQVAIFVSDGKIVEVFEPGRYTLESDNLPFLNTLTRLYTGGISPFNCKVIFVNNPNNISFRWGTDSKVQYIDSEYHFPLSIGVSGELSVSISDTRKAFLNFFSFDQNFEKNDVSSKFRSLLMTRIKSYIAKVMKECKINIFEIDENLDMISEDLKKLLQEDFDKYGFYLVDFFVTNVVKPEDDENYKHYKDIYYKRFSIIEEAKINQQSRIIDAETSVKISSLNSFEAADKRKREGYSYREERLLDILEKSSTNVNSATEIVQLFEKYIQENQTMNNFCEMCGNKISTDSLYCSKCGCIIEKYIECPNCGKSIKQDKKFCSHCGFELN